MIYIYIYILLLHRQYACSEHILLSMDQPEHGCQSSSWSAQQGKIIFPCPPSRRRIWSVEMGSAVPSRVSPLIVHTQAESDWLVLTHGIPPAFRDGVQIYR